MNSVDIIIPAYNEEKTIEEILGVVEGVDFCGLKKNIIVIDDCSTDSTASILKKYEDKYKIIYKEQNGGKGSAVYEGIQNSTGDIVIIQDADLEYNPKDYVSLLEPVIKGEADVVYGSRFLNNSFKNFIFLSYLANRFLTFLTNILFNSNLTDMETCYKVIKRDCIKNIIIKSKKFDIEPEITAKLLKSGVKIKELPIAYNARDFKDGKKITYKDGIIAIFTLLKYRFVD